MAIALDAPSPDAQTIVRAYLIAALASDGAEALAKVERMGCAEEFQAAISAWIGYTGDASDFIALGRHVLLCALAGALPNDAGSVLPADVTSGSTVLCQDIVRGWCRALSGTPCSSSRSSWRRSHPSSRCSPRCHSKP